MKNLLIATLALALPLALAGCNKEKKNEGDADSGSDAEMDHTGDGTDVPEETPEEPADDPADDTVVDAVEDGEEDAPLDTDDDAVIDAPDDAEDAAGDEDVSSACPGTDLGTFTPGGHFGGVDTSYNMWMLVGSISSDLTTEPISFLSLESFGDYGGPTTTGTTTLGSWVSYATCGLCIAVYENCTTSSGCTRYYMAEQATLDITAISMTVGGTLTGTLSGVILSEWNSSTDSLVSGGVQMCVDLWSFSETLVDAS